MVHEASSLWKNLLKEWKDKLQTGRKYFQITYQTMDKYVKKIKRCSKSLIIRKMLIKITEVPFLTYQIYKKLKSIANILLAKL